MRAIYLKLGHGISEANASRNCHFPFCVGKLAAGKGQSGWWEGGDDVLATNGLSNDVIRLIWLGLLREGSTLERSHRRIAMGKRPLTHESDPWKRFTEHPLIQLMSPSFL